MAVDGLVVVAHAEDFERWTRDEADQHHVGRCEVLELVDQEVAVAGLDVTNIVVTDAATGRPFTAPKPGTAVALDDLEARQKMEEHFANKIKQLFGNIPGLLVAVSDTRRRPSPVAAMSVTMRGRGEHGDGTAVGVGVKVGAGVAMSTFATNASERGVLSLPMLYVRSGPTRTERLASLE